MKKRYQFWGPNGLTWTKWFKCEHCEEKWQLKNKLLNEYEEESTED